MARIDPRLAAGINAMMKDHIMENYERYYLMAYSIVKNEQQTVNILNKAFYFSLYNGRKLKSPPKMKTWFFQLVIKAGMRKMHELDRYKRDFTEESRLYAYMETLEPSAVNAFKLYYFENLSMDEIGKILHFNQKEIEGRLKLVRHELKIDSSMDEDSVERLHELIDIYDNVTIPENLENVILDIMQMEQENFDKYIKRQGIYRWLKPVILVACLALWFFGTIALAKSNQQFADSILDIPIIRRIFINFI